MGTILHLRQKLSHSKLMFSLCGEAGAVQYQHHLEDAAQMAWRCRSRKTERNRLSLKGKVLQTGCCLPQNNPGSFVPLSLKLHLSCRSPHQLTQSCAYGTDWVDPSVKYLNADTTACILLMQRDAGRSQIITRKIQRISSLCKQEEFPGEVVEAHSSLKFPEKPKIEKKVI